MAKENRNDFEDGIPELKVKFDRSAVQALLKVGDYESIVITVKAQSSLNNES